MANINLSSYRSLQVNYFVSIEVDGGSGIYVSDYHKTFTANTITYTGVGGLLSIGKTTSNIRATSEELTIGLSGIPATNVTNVITNKIKGGVVIVQRAIFDPVTGNLLVISNNPSVKFRGVVNNFSIGDDLDGSDGELTIAITATSQVDQLTNKITGRRTNPIDQEEFYPGDQSFDRVPRLANSNFNFGAPN